MIVLDILRSQLLGATSSLLQFLGRTPEQNADEAAKNLELHPDAAQPIE